MLNLSEENNSILSGDLAVLSYNCLQGAGRRGRSRGRGLSGLVAVKKELLRSFVGTVEYEYSLVIECLRVRSIKKENARDLRAEEGSAPGSGGQGALPQAREVTRKRQAWDKSGSTARRAGFEGKPAKGKQRKTKGGPSEERLCNAGGEGRAGRLKGKRE